MTFLSSLNREQKQSIFLLQIGTFLEYFDLMLYVHMAVLLNELFFPKTDPHTASLLSAFAFCSAFVFRPIGALIFGWIGDHIGRKFTIVITTFMMAVSCIIMANLPTYAQIGISAAWILTLCRIIQGISSMGEVIGAQIYITETIERPMRYPATAFTNVASVVGELAALGVAFYVTSKAFNWRIAFWIGAIIAVIGAIARTKLRETPDFLEMKRNLIKQVIQKGNIEDDPNGAVLNATWKQPVKKKTLLSYFLVSCGYPLCFYLIYVFFNPLLKEKFGYSAGDIIKHNFYLSIISTIIIIFVSLLSYKFHPLKINKARGILAILLMIALPFLIINVDSSKDLFFIQSLILILTMTDTPSTAVFLSHFPLYRRFTYASFLFSISRALMYIITSFGLVYLGNYFGHYGLWFITLPVASSFLYGIYHFEALERDRGILPSKIS